MTKPLQSITFPGLPDEYIAAPGGYGLGDAVTLIDSWNNAIKTGFYRSESDSATGRWMYGLAINYAGGITTQIALSHSATTLNVAMRAGMDGVWQPWEWIDPPMEVGVEYRTTERYNNQPVYVKRTGSVQLPASSARSISYCDDTNVKATPVSVQPLYTASCAAEYSAIAGIPPFIEKVWADANELGFGNSVSFTSNSYTDTGYDTDSATVSAIVKYIKEVVA